MIPFLLYKIPDTTQLQQMKARLVWLEAKEGVPVLDPLAFQPLVSSPSSFLVLRGCTDVLSLPWPFPGWGRGKDGEGASLGGILRHICHAMTGVGYHFLHQGIFLIHWDKESSPLLKLNSSMNPLMELIVIYYER